MTKFLMTCDELKKIIPKVDLLGVKTLKFKDEVCMQHTLGMTWCSQDNCFKFNCSFLTKCLKKLTRHVILSVYSQIFDPLRFLQPFVLHPKLIIQELSRLGLSWDDEVPLNVKKDWNKWLSGIKDISNFDFPRCVVQDNSYKSTEMHVFSDSIHETYAKDVCNVLREICL